MNRRASLVLGIIILSCALALFANYNAGDRLPPPLWVAACAAILATVAALFGDIIKRWMWSPRLVLEYRHEAPYCDNTPYYAPNGDVQAAAYFFRLAVRNEGDASAENVEVILQTLHRIDSQGKRHFVRPYSTNLGWMTAGTKVLDRLSPRMERLLDFGKILHPTDRKHVPAEDSTAFAHGAVFSLEIRQFVHVPRFVIDDGHFGDRYELRLVVVANNSRPQPYSAYIQVKGWDADLSTMLRDKVAIEITQAH
jgi:hypothetical protein